MTPIDDSSPWPKAAAEFDRRTGRSDGAAIVAGLDAGLDLLRDTLYLRLHRDVEQEVGMDSMLMPVSEVRSEVATKNEIEVYHLSVSTALVNEQGYVAGSEDWFADWLARWRLGRLADDRQLADRLASYAPQSADEKRLAFTDVLARTLRESTEAPLVLFRLLPEAVGIATALAFGDSDTAERLRARQIECLPAIAECRQCSGRVLEVGRKCDHCSNPLWDYIWLTSSA